MNAVNPPLASCWSRNRCRCSMRSSIVSTWPNIIVALEFKPSSCATSITSSHWSLLHFERRDALPHAIHQNLAAAARNRAEPRFLKTRDDFPQRHLEHLREMVELRRAEPVDVDLRKFFPDVAEQIEIPIEAELRMMPALHQDLHAARPRSAPRSSGRSVRRVRT